MAKRKPDIPLDQSVALVRACQKLNCDTADQLFAMVERRCSETASLREALEPLARYYQLNDCRYRRADDALEVPVRDLRRIYHAFFGH